MNIQKCAIVGCGAVGATDGQYIENEDGSKIGSIEPLSDLPNVI